MFENYSLQDSFANLYKHRKINVLIAVLLFISIAIPITLKTVRSTSIVRTQSSYSSYLMYKIDAPPSVLGVDNYYGRYSDFYSKLLNSNLNGAFLFNGVDDERLQQIATEISSNSTQLKNSNFDFWEKKIVITPIVDNAGVSVKILTQSKDLNTLVEEKMDRIIEEYKTTFNDVYVTKLDTVYSEKGKDSEDMVVGYSKKRLILSLGMVVFLSLFITIVGNVAFYIFVPTMNRAGDFARYHIDFIYEMKSGETVSSIINYKKEAQGRLAILSSNAKILEKFKQEFQTEDETIVFLTSDNVPNLLESTQVLLVEEYGVTRYHTFEKKLQLLQNLNRTLIGVMVYPL